MQSPDKTEEQAAIFAVLADPTRLKLFDLLKLQGENDAVCVSALAILLNVTQSAVSQHLRVLKSAGLAKGERRGYHTHYFINHNRLNSIRKVAMQVFEMNGDGGTPVCKAICSKVENQVCADKMKTEHKSGPKPASEEK